MQRPTEASQKLGGDTRSHQLPLPMAHVCPRALRVTADVTNSIRRYGMLSQKHSRQIREHSQTFAGAFAHIRDTFAEVHSRIRTHSRTFAHIRAAFAHIRGFAHIRAHSRTFAHIRARAPQIRRRYANIREQIYRDSRTFTTECADPR